MVDGKAAGKKEAAEQHSALSTAALSRTAWLGEFGVEKRAGFATTRRSPAGRPAWGVGEPAEPSAPPRPHSDPSSESPAAGKETPRRCRHLLPRLPPPNLHAIGQPQVAALLVASRKRKEESERSLGRRGTPETQDAMRASKGPVWSCDLDSNPETVAAPDHDSSHCSTQYDLICLCL